MIRMIDAEEGCSIDIEEKKGNNTDGEEKGLNTDGEEKDHNTEGEEGYISMKSPVSQLEHFSMMSPVSQLEIINDKTVNI